MGAQDVATTAQQQLRAAAGALPSQAEVEELLDAAGMAVRRQASSMQASAEPVLDEALAALQGLQEGSVVIVQRLQQSVPSKAAVEGALDSAGASMDGLSSAAKAGLERLRVQ